MMLDDEDGDALLYSLIFTCACPGVHVHEQPCTWMNKQMYSHTCAR